MEEGIEDEEGRGVSCAFNHSSNYSPEAVLPNYLWGAHGPSPSFFLLRESPSLLFSLRFSLSLPSEAKRATIEELKLFELAHGCPECFQRKERKNELVARATSTDEKKKKPRVEIVVPCCVSLAVAVTKCMGYVVEIMISVSKMILRVTYDDGGLIASEVSAKFGPGRLFVGRSKRKRNQT